MTPIKNSNNKTVCMVDSKDKVVEILFKGCITTIKFNADGTVNVTNKNK